MFGSYASEAIGPQSDLDVLIVRATVLGIVERVADLKLAARGAVGIDLVVVTPQEYRTTFRASSFGSTDRAGARRLRLRRTAARTISAEAKSQNM